MPFLKSPILLCTAQRFFLLAVLIKEMLQLRNNIVSIQQTDQNRDRNLKALSPRLLVLPFPNRSHDLRTVYGTNSRTRASDQLKIVTGFLQRPVCFQSRYVLALLKAYKSYRKRIIITILLSVIRHCDFVNSLVRSPGFLVIRNPVRETKRDASLNCFPSFSP